MMDVSRIAESSLYKEFKTELQICNIGGLFLALYQDERVFEIVNRELKADLPDYFVFQLQMSDQKVGFPTFFEQTFTQMGKKNNIFHVTGIEQLPEKLRLNFIDYLQYTRERFKAKAYSIVFWITPQFEKQLFFSAPDFHHWISGTYDFSKIVVESNFLKETDVSQKEQMLPLEKIVKYLDKVVWQYEHWQEVRDTNEEFLIEVMERANLFDYYVTSYCIDKNGKEFLLDDLFDEFLADNKRNFLTLLGDFGTGKTSFSLHYYIYMAKQLLNDRTKRIPIFISLRNYKGKLNIEDFMVKEFYEKYNIQLSFAIFQELALQGKFVFFVDGFDEMASLADKKLTIQNLKELTKLSFESILFMTKKQSDLQGANKVFLTCRTHYFLTEIQESEVLKADYTVLYRNYATKSNYEITRIKLKEFNDQQIEEYIFNNTRDEEKASVYMGIIKNTYNLEELSTRPILLDMIIKTLPGLKDKKKINASHLYKAYTGIWIEREDWRSQMTAEGKRCFMWELALKMFKEGGDFTVHYSKLNKPNETHFKEDFQIRYDDYYRDDDYYRYETTTCCFLNRDQDGNYKFIHKSFMEFFLAEYFFHRIKRKEERIISPDQLNKETEFFLKLIISAGKSDLENLDLSNLNLGGIDLEGANLQGAKLDGANLLGTNLYGAIMEKCDLQNANLRGIGLPRAVLRWTKLQGAELQNIDLRGADLLEADLRRADLRGADLHSTNLKGTDLRQSNLQNASLQRAILHDANLQGSDLRGADLRGTNLRGANLKGAILENANLQISKLDITSLKNSNLHGAILRGSDLQQADLQGFDLQNVNLILANLQGANLREADLCNSKLMWVDFLRANLQGANIHSADLHGANIILADLQNANLEGANFKEANLTESNLKGATFYKTNFQTADLSDAKNITYEMLLEVRSLYQCKGLDPKIEEKLRKKKPELFENPGE